MTLERLRQKAYEMYNDGTFGTRMMLITDANPKLIRHDDELMNNHGTWVDCSVWVPDDDDKEAK